MDKGALIIAVNEHGEILLQHKDNDAPKYANQWVLFGGGIESGEASESAIKRELLEELSWPIDTAIHFKEYPENDVFLIRTTKTSGELRKALNEGNDAQFFSHDQLKNLDIAALHRQIITDYFLPRVLFICRGNAFRSIIAEAYLNSLQLKNVNVASRGSVAEAFRSVNAQRFLEVQALLRHHDLFQFAKANYAEQLTQNDIDQSNIVVCLDNRVFNPPSEKFTIPENTQIWNVADIGDEGHIAHNQNELLHIEEGTYLEIKAVVDNFVNSAGLRA